jgi:RNA polymerase sigma factor for flagellar operon FliA
MESATKVYREVSNNQRRDALITEHLDFVQRIYGSLAANLPSDVDEENLKSAGVLGLIEAAQNYDPQRGVAFKTFAYPRIRGAIIDELRRNSPLSQRLLQRIGIVRSILERFEPPVSPEILARETGWTPAEVEECLEAMQLTRSQSLDELEQVAQNQIQSRFLAPDERMQREETLIQLADAIAALPERERVVLTLYHQQGLLLKEIGQVLDVSESRVSRILAQAQFRIQEQFRNQM